MFGIDAYAGARYHNGRGVVVLLAPASVATATLLDLESLFAEIDDKVVRITDYSGVLQACTRIFFSCICRIP
jgi:hypothetical protein